MQKLARAAPILVLNNRRVCVRQSALFQLTFSTVTQAGSTVSRVVHLHTVSTLVTQPLWHLSLHTPQLSPWEVTPIVGVI